MGLDDLVAENGAQTMFYMTWGRRNGDGNNPGLFPDYLTMQEMITEGYMRYVQACSTSSRPVFVSPVGLVFQTIYNDLVRQDVNPPDEGTLFNRLYVGDGR